MKVGFVGLGAMGLPMARNLHFAGLLSAVWNRSSEKAQSLAAELGIAAPETLSALASSVDAVMICVSADHDVLDVVKASQATLDRARSYSIAHGQRRDPASAPRKTSSQSRRRLPRLSRERGRGGRAGCDARVMAGGEPRRSSARSRYFKPWARPSRSSVERRRTGDKGDQPDHVRGHHPGRGRGDGVRESTGAAPREGGRHARQGRRLELVFRQPRAEHDPRELSGGLSGAAACEGSAGSAATWRRIRGRLPVVERMLGEYAELIERGFGDEDISADFRLKAELFDKSRT